MIEPFLRNYWYICAWREELNAKPLQRWILGEPIALFRTESGRVAAITDRCPHRGAPMTTGVVRGEALHCGYHGLAFDRAGKCTKVPGRDSVPPAFATRAYPVAEKWRFVFIWMGDPAKADEALIPDYHWTDDPAWTARGETLPVNCHASLLRDNLLDLSHAHFVHAKTLATDEVISAPIAVKESDAEVSVLRVMKDIAPSPFFASILGKQTRRVNHRQHVRFWPASNVVIETTVTDLDDASKVADIRVMNCLTPATANSSHYFWSIARNMQLQDDALSDLIFTSNRNTFFEDVDVLERQQVMLERAPSPHREIRFHVDGGVDAAHRLVARLAERERERENWPPEGVLNRAS